jgi:hypothetical protein
MSAPAIDPRGPAAVDADLADRVPGYLTEWTPGARGPADALLHAIARYQYILAQGLNRVPERWLLAGLDALGMHLAPASPARVPLVFALAADAPLDVTLPAGSQVAAPALPAPPVVEAGRTAPPAPEPVVFATERAVTLSRGRLRALYSIEPGADRFADHTGRLTNGFTLFDEFVPMEHALYLGHDTLFALGGEISLLIGASLERGAASSLDLQWEYLTDVGWIPLPAAKEHDTTAGFVGSGQLTLTRECGPDARQATFAGHTSYWLRARPRTPVIGGMNALPLVVNDLTARVAFRKRGLLPEAAFADVIKLDVSKDFHPFGTRPALFSTFYLASTEVFQRGGARAELRFDLSVPGTPKAPFVLAWEYSTGDGWRGLTVTPDPGEVRAAATEAFEFSASGSVHFICPSDWADVDVNGTTKRWLRVRVVQGDFGASLHLDPTTKRATLVEDLVPPVVSRLRLSFEYRTDPSPLDHCLSFNDFVFRDHTEACRWPDQTFAPFRAVAESAPAVHLGFDTPLPAGLVSLYVDVPAASVASGAVSPYVWEYRREDGWAELSVVDDTSGFRQSGMVQFIGPREAVATDGFGGRLHRIRARLKQGEFIAASPVAGMWLNAVWGAHHRRIERELLGLSDGNPGQTLGFSRTPVLEGETIEVLEWTGRGDAWRIALADVPDADVRIDRDPATQLATAIWVRWHERPHLHDSTPADRHYAIERATGRLRFGTGVPGAGRRIVATYATGGGVAGNVAASAVRELRTAIPFIAGVDNPVRAQGGAEAEATAAILRRGPERLRHRDRALSARDYEWVARDASPEVARAHCTPLRGSNGHAERGWVTIALVPQSAEARPAPSPELARRVRAYAAAHAPAVVAIRLVPAVYAAVSVLATLTPVDPSLAAIVESRVRAALNRFLHPLRGGPDGQGWEFGEPVHASQIASVIESTPGVDFAVSLVLECEGVVCDAVVPVPANALVAAGHHELTLKVGGR